MKVVPGIKDWLLRNIKQGRAAKKNKNNKVKPIAAKETPKGLDQHRETAIRSFKNLDSYLAGRSRVTVIFIHYHPNDFFAPGFLKLIDSAHASGYRVVVTSNAGISAIPRLEEKKDILYIQRANIGYDFGALRDVRGLLKMHGLLESSRYVVINSSMLNVASLGFGQDPILDRLADRNQEKDLLGVTASYETENYHIQSYFYSLSGRLFNSKRFGRFLDFYWKGMNKSGLSPRNYAIKRGELRLTSWAKSKGFKVGSIFDYLHLPGLREYRVMNELLARVSSALKPKQSIETLEINSGLTEVLAMFSREWLPKPGLQHNPCQAWWAIMIASNFYFIKREVLEHPHSIGGHSLSASALLLTLLHALDIEIPDWSDLSVLDDLIHGSR